MKVLLAQLHLSHMEEHIDASGVSDVFIKDLLAQMHISHLFKGVFFTFDPQLHSLICEREVHPDFVCIVNTGRHFVTLVLDKESALYIDTLARHCPMELRLKLEKSKRTVYYNKKRIQSITSTHCGLYSCLFALYFDRERNDRSVSTQFRFESAKDKLEVNDIRCIKYLKQMAQQ